MRTMPRAMTHSLKKRKGAQCMTLTGSEAKLYSKTPPNGAQRARFERFLSKKYGEGCSLIWVEDQTIENGFQLEVGHDLYDWTREGRFQQFKELLEELSKRETDEAQLITLFKTSIEEWKVGATPEEEGNVEAVGDGIAIVNGLEGVVYGEVVLFECGVTGMVQDLQPDHIGVILFGDEEEIIEGSRVRRTKKTAGIPVGEGFLGRVINALGEPIDGLGQIQAEGFRPVESEAPGIIDREPVDTPMNTGILSIDSMFPIGRGQRELIIGDRQTGKTALAIDTVLNQKDTGVICIYVAIGQKASSVAHMVDTLRQRGAMGHTIVMIAGASESASVQYIAPYAATALAEYFMYEGRDVLIIYDDLSKHAIAYRALSLILERSPGREAYPGDVFYLHSRLLERSARLSEEIGGGSITALPIVETQAGDVSAYIPTNIISITDGQIFLESDLFFSGQRPAVNVGLSVSRVGGAAQTQAMKKAVGSLRLDLAQFREMEVFTQFSSDLDEVTKKRLQYGQGLMRLLRQEQWKPYALHEQVILLTAAIAHVMQDLPVSEIVRFKDGLLAYFHIDHTDICRRIDDSGMLTDEQKEDIIRFSRQYMELYLKIQARKREKKSKQWHQPAK
ncbi:MAG: F0F1 ATP synthase subunit alpha [Lachnospiraceae bacterium]|nr:F0F1 ATP synthase subunit alpha [Lachnospiraceae bacterium]